MKILTVTFLALVMFGAFRMFEGETKPMNFEDTIKWIRDFTTMHGVTTSHGVVTQENKMIGAGGCDVQVTHDFICADKTAHSIKHTSLFISLSDLDPTQVHFQAIHYEGDNFFRINFERTDSALKIKVTRVLGDDETVTEDQSGDYLQFDSSESAEAFGKTLVHAIKLCGGKPAPL
ncbi:MAG: hypothetical protein JO119_05705 [Acidobacteria bacterium]|nr:hypothetical protein [Acidobacteriota bacterium]